MELFNLKMELRRLWLEAGCPKDLTDFVNRLDVMTIHRRINELEKETK